MNLPSRLDLANLTEDEYINILIAKTYHPEFHIWFEILQNAATRLKKGNPEDMELHTRTFESACTAMARYLGLAPEIEKEESSVRMKCVKCDLIKTGDVCECGGTEFKVVEDGEHVWLGGKK